LELYKTKQQIDRCHGNGGTARYNWVMTRALSLCTMQ
jgi:hypothetical protein